MSYLLLLLPPYINLNPLSGYPLHPGRHGDGSRYFYLISFTKHILCLPPSPLTGKLLALVPYLATAVQCFALTPLSDKHPPPHPPRVRQWRGSILPPMSLKQKLIKYPANNAAVVHYLLGRYFIFLGLFFLSQGGPVRSISTTPGSVLQSYFLCLFSVNKMLVRATKLHWAEQQI